MQLAPSEEEEESECLAADEEGEQEHSESLRGEKLEYPATPKTPEPLPVPSAGPGPTRGDGCPQDPPIPLGGNEPSLGHLMPSRGENPPPAGPLGPVIPRGEVPMPVSTRGPPREADMMDLLVASAYGIPKTRLPYFGLLDMALGNLVGVYIHLSEHFKFQILLDHLKLPSAYKS